jgi:HD-GYP domain-containing protein (c-di-GMP phosphodiesterase class II)
MLGSSTQARALLRLAPTEATDAVRPLLVMEEILESRYEDMSSHGATVADYCVITAEELGRPRRDVERLALAGALHDIGKIAIEERILRKPSRLTADEWREVELHPDISANLLFSSELFDVGRWVRAHHERLDGRGYPRGLGAERIPLEARIVAVADAYDAMRTKRVYRPAMSHEQACEELVRGAGTQFDAGVAQAFLTALGRRGGRLRRQDAGCKGDGVRQRRASSPGFFNGTSA